MANELFIPSTIDATLASSIADYTKTVTDNVYNKNVLLSNLNSVKELVNGGVSKVFPLIKGDQNAGGFYLGSGMLNTTQTDQETLVEYRWQNLYEPIQINRDEERSNSGDPHRIFDLLAEKIQRSELAISKRAEQAMSTPVAGANNLKDIDTLIATGTFGTIAGATDTFWQANVTASGSFAAQGLSDATTGFYAVASSADSDTVTLILTDKTNFQRLENTRSPLERIQNGTLKANAGFRSLSFKGVDVIYGNFITSGTWNGLNMNYIHYCVDSETDFAMTPFMMPVNQTAKVAFILHRTTGPVTDNRRRHYKLTGLTA